jgi:hypothetical protein
VGAGGGGGTWLDGVSGAELSGAVEGVVEGVVAGSGVFDAVESPELQPARTATTTQAAAGAISRFHTPQHGTRRGRRHTGCHARRH